MKYFEKPPPPSYHSFFVEAWSSTSMEPSTVVLPETEMGPHLAELFYKINCLKVLFD